MFFCTVLSHVRGCDVIWHIEFLGPPLLMPSVTAWWHHKKYNLSQQAKFGFPTTIPDRWNWQIVNVNALHLNYDALTKHGIVTAMRVYGQANRVDFIKLAFTGDVLGTGSAHTIEVKLNLISNLLYRPNLDYIRSTIINRNWRSFLLLQSKHPRAACANPCLDLFYSNYIYTTSN